MKQGASELRKKSYEDLLNQLDDLKEELFNLRFQQTSGQLEDVNRISVTKRNVARVMTVLREKELEINNG